MWIYPFSAQFLGQCLVMRSECVGIWHIVQCNQNRISENAQVAINAPEDSFSKMLRIPLIPGGPRSVDGIERCSLSN